MKVNYTVGDLTFAFDADTIKEAFNQVATIQEVFGEKKCGKCGSENIKTVVRENDGNEYHEYRCGDCSARLSFGAHKKGGGLFPRRKDSEGSWLPSNGWQKWNPKTKKLE